MVSNYYILCYQIPCFVCCCHLNVLNHAANHQRPTGHPTKLTSFNYKVINGQARRTKRRGEEAKPTTTGSPKQLSINNWKGPKAARHPQRNKNTERNPMNADAKIPSTRLDITRWIPHLRHMDRYS